MKSSIFLVIFVSLIAKNSYAAPWQRLLLKEDESEFSQEILEQNIVVPAGKIIEFQQTHWFGTAQVELDFGDEVILKTEFITGRLRAPDSSSGQEITETRDLFLINNGTKYIGPLTATIRLDTRGLGIQRLLTWYRLIDDSGTAPAVSPTSVVIPEDVEGEVRIVLESSTDFKNWVEANSGVYSSSSVRRFFRLRALRQ